MAGHLLQLRPTAWHGGVSFTSAQERGRPRQACASCCTSRCSHELRPAGVTVSLAGVLAARRATCRPVRRRCQGQLLASQQQALLVRPRSVRAMLVASGLSLLGFTMPTPVLPELQALFALSASQVGLIFSSFAAGMLFAVMVLPGLSDRMGRKPVASIALACTSLGFLAQGLAINLGLDFKSFLLLRFATGLFAGYNPIFKAYLADVVPAQRLPQYMIYRESSATLAFVVGPTLGGFLAAISGSAAPLFATSAAHGLAALIMASQVDESVVFKCQQTLRDLLLEYAPKRRQYQAVSPGDADVEHPANWPLVMLVFVMSFLYVNSQTCFSSFLPLLMSDRLGASAQAIGLFATKVSLIALGFQLLAYKPMERSLGLEKTGAFGAVCISLGLAGLAFSGHSFWLPAALYAIGVASFPATVPTLLARAVPRSRRGFVMGMDSIMNNLCRVQAPVVLGLLYTRQPSLCFSAGSASMLAVLVLLLATVCKK